MGLWIFRPGQLECPECNQRDVEMRRLAFLLTATVLSHASLCGAQTPVHVGAGFAKGIDYLRKTEDERREYVMGVIDGMLTASLFASQDLARLDQLHDCLSKSGAFTDLQLKLMVDKYLADHPERLDQQANVLVYNALMGRCPMK